MSNNLPNNEQNQEFNQTGGLVDPPAITNNPDALFDLAKNEVQIRRHETIGELFDQAAEVIQNYLNDPSLELSAKMFPAKLATDIYLTQEKFRREDERIAIEKRKLMLDEAKSGKLPVSGTFNQQNNYFINGKPTGQKTADKGLDLKKIKKKQEELLASFRDLNKK